MEGQNSLAKSLFIEVVGPRARPVSRRGCSASSRALHGLRARGRRVNGRLIYERPSDRMEFSRPPEDQSESPLSNRPRLAGPDPRLFRLAVPRDSAAIPCAANYCLGLLRGLLLRANRIFSEEEEPPRIRSTGVEVAGMRNSWELVGPVSVQLERKSEVLVSFIDFYGIRWHVHELGFR